MSFFKLFSVLKFLIILVSNVLFCNATSLSAKCGTISDLEHDTRTCSPILSNCRSWKAVWGWAWMQEASLQIGVLGLFTHLITWPNTHPPTPPPMPSTNPPRHLPCFLSCGNLFRESWDCQNTWSPTACCFCGWWAQYNFWCWETLWVPPR